MQDFWTINSTTIQNSLISRSTSSRANILIETQCFKPPHLSHLRFHQTTTWDVFRILKNNGINYSYPYKSSLKIIPINHYFAMRSYIVTWGRVNSGIQITLGFHKPRSLNIQSSTSWNSDKFNELLKSEGCVFWWISTLTQRCKENW